jgi:hypothetical protein
MKEHGYLHEDGSTSYTTRLVQTVPEIADGLQSIQNQMSAGFKDQKQESAERKTDADASQAIIQKTYDIMQYWMTSWASGNIDFRLKMPTPPPELVAIAAAGAAAAVTVPITPLLPASIPAVPAASASASAPALAIPPSLSSSASLSPPQDQISHAAISVPQTPPQYKMSRDTRSVEGLYHEWTQGLRGALPIRELDRRYGHHWRKGRRDELQFYSLRKEVLREIERIVVREGIDEITAARRLQGRQDGERLSLDKLCKRLREETKARAAAAAAAAAARRGM